jgi:hypothetical protein
MVAMIVALGARVYCPPNDCRGRDATHKDGGMPEPQGPLEARLGGCHCGKVRYEVKLALGTVYECNCSMCSKKAALMTFVPAEQFRLLSGDEELTDYQWNKEIIHHVFCRTCGIHSFARGTDSGGRPMCMINARCLDGGDPSSLKVVPIDGKSR